jgi:hypothetical protein
VHFSWKVPGESSAWFGKERGCPTAKRWDNIAQDVVDIPGDAVNPPCPPEDLIV